MDINNKFLSGRMEKDLDERIIGDTVYRDALNIKVDVSDTSNVGSVQNSLGNSRVSDLSVVTGQPLLNARTIGAVTYERDNLIYWLVSADNFDGIYEFNAISGTTKRVLQSNKATPTTISQLNFNKEYIVTGINYINGFLYWTDNLNPPRKINISRAKSYNINDPRIDDDLNVIIAPPLSAPNLALSVDQNDPTANNMYDKFLYFSYRYKYIDGQYSSISPFSAVSFVPGSLGFDYNAGNNISMQNSYNQVEIAFNTGGENVKEIQLLFRDSRNLNISIIESLNKSDLQYSNYSINKFLFKNNKNYTVLDADQATRLFDNVPLLAKCQDFVGDRLMYANYTQFYDIKDSNKIDINVNLRLSYVSESTAVNVPIRTWRSDRDYEVGIVYLDKYGRSTTVLTSQNNNTYIPATKSASGNSLMLTIRNKPPYWATNYRIVIKQNNKEYYNIFPLTFYVDGVFRYFLIHESDRDKIQVGDYIIFKCISTGPTFVNTKYKILELELKPQNFIPGGSGELPGLYFKIKVDQYELDLTAVTKYNFQGIGAGSMEKLLYNDKIPFNIFSTGYFPPYFPLDISYYGNGNKFSMGIHSVTYVASSGVTTSSMDQRFTIRIISPTQFKIFATTRQNGGLYADPAYIETRNIVINQVETLTSSVASNIRIKFTSTPTVGSAWTINYRDPNIKNNPPQNAAIVPDKDIAVKILTGAIITLKIEEDRFNSYLDSSLQVFPPATRSYDNIEEWWYESGACRQFKYTARDGTVSGAKYVYFYRADFWGTAHGDNTDFKSNYVTMTSNGTTTAPIRMFIQSSVNKNTSEQGQDQPKIVVSMTIEQQDNLTICETKPKENNLDIYHELSHTYPIVNNFHIVAWKYNDFLFWNSRTMLSALNLGATPSSSDIPHNFYVGDRIYIASSNTAYMPSGFYTVYAIPDSYNVVIDFTFPGSGPVTPGYIAYNNVFQNQQSSTLPAIIKINDPSTVNSDFNAWAFGNGLESDRILDDWNNTTLEYSIRSNSTVDEYKQKVSENAICYSGIYGINTGVNRLNEFNLSIANFKYLDKSFGSIQKIHARDTDLLAFQEEKISSILYGKNLLVDAVGGGQIASIPEVLGTQIAFQGEYGISTNPESFAKWGSDIFFADYRRGAVLNLSSNQLIVISNNGMKSHFRDLMRDTPNEQKLGGYDPHNHYYVISANENRSVPCKLELDRYSYFVQGTKAGSVDVTIPSLFKITTNEPYTITVVDIGFGTSWVDTPLLINASGDYVMSVKVSANTTGLPRNIKYVITYCGSSIREFTLTQGYGRLSEVTPIVFNNQIRTIW